MIAVNNLHLSHLIIHSFIILDLQFYNLKDIWTYGLFISRKEIFFISLRKNYSLYGSFKTLYLGISM